MEKRCLRSGGEQRKVSQSEEWVRSDEVAQAGAFDIHVELNKREPRKALPRKKNGPARLLKTLEVQ